MLFGEIRATSSAMLLGILGFFLFTGLLTWLGFYTAATVEGYRKIGAWLLVFAGWAATVAYATHLAGFWGNTAWMSRCIPDSIGIPFCVLVFSFPITAPLIAEMANIWKLGGENPPMTGAEFGMEETVAAILYAGSLWISYCLTEFFHISNWWSFPISLPLLALSFRLLYGFINGICGITTQLARRFSPARKRSRKLEIK